MEVTNGSVGWDHVVLIGVFDRFCLRPIPERNPVGALTLRRIAPPLSSKVAHSLYSSQ